MGDARALLRQAAALVERGTPVALLAAGRSAPGARAALSHTGALATDGAVLAAACRDAGVILVDSPTALIEATRIAALRRRPARGARRRLGIVADGGGHGVVAADLAVAAGLAVAPFRAGLAARLAAVLPAAAAAANPVDLAGGGERDLGTYARVVREVAASGEVDAVLLTGYFGAYAVDDPALTDREVAAAAEVAAVADVPVLAHSLAPGSPACAALEAGGVPVWPAAEHAVSAAAALLRPRRSWIRPVSMGPSTTQDPREWGIVAFPPGEHVTDAAAAVEAAGRAGYPVVVKALGVAHKTDVGGIALGLTGPDEVRAAAEDMARRLAPPGLRVERMVDACGGVEMIVGARRVPGFGPVVLVGSGGVLTEVLADTAVGLAPLDEDAARSMVDGLRGAPLLRGYRGAAPLAEAALVDLLVSVSEFVAARPDIRELDLNPILVTADRVVALDTHVEWACA